MNLGVDSGTCIIREASVPRVFDYESLYLIVVVSCPFLWLVDTLLLVVQAKLVVVFPRSCVCPTAALMVCSILYVILALFYLVVPVSKDIIGRLCELWVGDCLESLDFVSAEDFRSNFYRVTIYHDIEHLIIRTCTFVLS